MSRECKKVSRECTRVTLRKNIYIFTFFLSVNASANEKDSTLTAIATWRGEVRQAHTHRHFGYSKHRQGNGAVAQMMDDNRDGRGGQLISHCLVLNAMKALWQTG